MLTEMVLDKLGVFYDDIAKKKHGNCIEISYGYLIDTILMDKGSNATYTLFPVGMQTFNRLIHKIFPVKLNGGNETWYHYILSYIGYKNCGTCSIPKLFGAFSNSPNNSKLGISSICKSCKNIEQAGGYVKYIDSHKKSYSKHSSEIKARQQLYRGERSLRVPLWYDTQKKEIEEFYANCPAGYQVDHIIPLKGKLISGLHVIQNMQYLTDKENLSKGNRVDLDIVNSST